MILMFLMGFSVAANVEYSSLTANIENITRNNLYPYGIFYKDVNTPHVVYRNKRALLNGAQVFWQATLNLNAQSLSYYILLAKVKQLPTTISKIMLGEELDLGVVKEYSPILIHYNNLNQFYTFIFITNNTNDINQITLAPEGPKYKVYKLVHSSKQDLMKLLANLQSYVVGMRIKPQDKASLEKIALSIELTPQYKEYHVIWYTPHAYGECRNICEFTKRSMIYMIITLDHQHIISNIHLITQCCDGI